MLLGNGGNRKKEPEPWQMINVLAKQWLEYSRLGLTESSYIKYRNLLKNHIIPELGQIAISDLSTQCVTDFAAKKLKEGRKDQKGGLSEKTVRDILTIVHSICNYANRIELITPCRFDLIKLRCREKEVRTLNQEERNELENFLFQDESLVKTGILLSLFMGLRIGEVCALRKGNILYKEEILQIRFTMQRIQNPDKTNMKKTKIIVTEPKTEKAVRDIPIPDFLLGRLYVLWDLPDDAYILTGTAEKFIEPRTLENIFKRYLKECNMPDINYHALRHTFATRCIEAGFDIKSLSEILGHANVNITLNRYVHSSLEQKRENMKKLKSS